MNKKLLAIVGSATVAAAFWACGSGEIYEPTESDSIYGEMGAKALCADGCNGAFDVESSSSSSEEEFVPTSSFDNGDDDPIIIITSSSSEGLSFSPVESSGSLAPAGSLGKCEPVTTPINKGSATTQFTFKPNGTTSGYKAMDFAKAIYEWEYGAGATVSGSPVSTNSANVSYANSGAVVATVTVTMADGTTDKIQCSPLQVNGDPITGCTCTTDASGAVDFTATPDVTWSVTGCKSSSAVNSYAWAGGAAGASPSYTKTFTTATASFAPTLKVGNSDNTVIDVTCPAVKVTEGAEYEIKKSQDKVALPGAGTYAVVVSGGSSLTACRISCNANGDLTAKVNGKTFTGSYYVNFEGIDTSWCNKTLDFNVSAAATCEASWN